MKKVIGTRGSTFNHYDVREIAKGYVGISSVLAGFAFTSIILVLDKDFGGDVLLESFKNKAAIAFLLGFFGCMISAFIYSVMSGEEMGTTSRAYSMLLINGGVFSLSISFLFWGIVPLVRIYTNNEIVEISRWIYYIIVFYIILNFVISVIDLKNISLKKTKKYYKSLKPLHYALLIVFSYLPLILFVIYRTFFQDIVLNFAGCYNLFIISSLLLMLIGSVFSAIAANFDEKYVIPFNWCVFWIVCHSFILGSMTMILP
ncbi:MAG: hypothetical protein JNN28_02145 [Saprospiraceae bacterium]|nr:hypothetical protein [Saprospiraceae bacterium]